MQAVLRCLGWVFLAVLPNHAMAQLAPAQPKISHSAPAHVLGDLLLMDRTLDIMQREAVQSSAEMTASLFPDQNPEIWSNIVKDLFDPVRARAQLDQGLAAASLPRKDLDSSIAFFTSDLGQRILTLELSAREAMLDPAIKEAAQHAWAAAQLGPLPADAIRNARLSDIVQVNDLIESNVMAALNANLAYYQGMAKSGTLEGEIPQSDMLAEVWSQEDTLRRETEDWLYPFLYLAYQPLSIDDLNAYIAFSKSSAGRGVNAALFAAFDALGIDQSHGMGLAAGKLMAGQDI